MASSSSSSSSSSSHPYNIFSVWRTHPYIRQMEDASTAFAKPMGTFSGCPLDKIYNQVVSWLHANHDSSRDDLENIFDELENISCDTKKAGRRIGIPTLFFNLCLYRFNIHLDSYSNQFFEANLFVLALLESCTAFAMKLLENGLNFCTSDIMMRQAFITTNGKLGSGEYSPIMLSILLCDTHACDTKNYPHLTDSYYLVTHLLMLDRMLPFSTFPDVSNAIGDNLLLTLMKKKELVILTKVAFLICGSKARQYINPNYKSSILSVAENTGLMPFFNRFWNIHLKAPARFSDILTYDFKSAANRVELKNADRPARHVISGFPRPEMERSDSLPQTYRKRFTRSQKHEILEEERGRYPRRQRTSQEEELSSSSSFSSLSSFSSYK